ncbi:MAG: methyltransferase domain-containing protein [Candidatus Promineifilaceae bacterium]
MDELAKYNQERWEALVAAGIEYGRPLLDLDKESARAWVTGEALLPDGAIDNLAGKDVFVLAGGGGQQTAALSLLGANVTVLDLTEAQLAGDRLAAEHYGYDLRIEQGDMRDLSRFDDDAFDFVWQPYSINFVPDYRPVLDGVARVLRPGGCYRLDIANPFAGSIWEDSWHEKGYALNTIYKDGSEHIADDPHWDVTAADGSLQHIIGPREFQHALGPLLTYLADLGFVLKGMWERPDDGDPDAQPGTWEHFISVMPPWLWMLFSYEAQSGWECFLER